MPSTLLPFETLHNIRDLGGMPAADGRRIRSGKLIRSGHLADISDTDRAHLAGLVDMIVDFRTTEEESRQPDREIPGAAYYHIPVIDSLTAGITREKEADQDAITLLLFKPKEALEYMKMTYTGFVLSDFARSRYTRFLNLVLAHSRAEAGAQSGEGSGAQNMANDGTRNGAFSAAGTKAILWHCTAGKDRAGIGTVLLQEILGVPRKEIFADYLYTNECLVEDIGRLTRFFKQKAGRDDPVIDESLHYLFGAHEAYLATFYALVEQKFGSMDAFLREALSVTDDMRQTLQDAFLA